MGKIADADKQDVGRFLNRMLGLEPEWQAYLFDLFQAMMEHVVSEAKRDGKYQDGIVDVKATSVELKEPPRVSPRPKLNTSWKCAVLVAGRLTHSNCWGTFSWISFA